MINNLYQAVKNAKEAFHTISRVWEINKDVKDIMESKNCYECYPFDKGFEEICFEMDEWFDSILNEIKFKKASHLMVNALIDAQIDKDVYPVAVKSFIESLNNKYGFNLKLEDKDEEL